MCSARLFLPFIISLFMNRVSVRLPKRGSGGTSLLITRARLGTLSPFLRSRARAFPRSKWLLNTQTRQRVNALTHLRTSLVQAVQRTAAFARRSCKYRLLGWLKGLFLPQCVKQARYVIGSRLVSRRIETGYLAGAFGAFAPYLDRPCLRSLTPPASSAPRTM